MELTLGEVKPIIKYIIENNKKLQERGSRPIAVNLCGSCGIGKTSMIEQVAEELGCNMIKLSLAQLTDPAELCGWPIKEHYICYHDDEHPENDECKWITGELIEGYARAGWKLTEETRMGYAIPAWLKSIDPNKPTIWFADDYSRK